MNGQCLKRKLILSLSIICITFMTLFPFIPVSSEEVKEPKVLVIYTSDTGEFNERQRELDMLISHFTTDVTFKSSNEVTKEDLASVTHLFYYGQAYVELLPPTFIDVINGYNGIFVAMGYNVQQFGDRFSFVRTEEESVINQLFITGSDKAKMTVSDYSIIGIAPDESMEILLEGTTTGDGSTYPVMVKKQNNYYYAFNQVYFENSVLFGEILHGVFQVDHSEAKHPGYIRLEDVHPLVNPEPLKEIADILKEKNIPYMVAVIPIYTNPETGEKHTFTDSPELVNVLKQIQKDGGSIVLHGYTHQYRASETGEGFEFWDVDNNLPVYSPADEPFTMKTEESFPTKEAYDEYLEGLKAFEREYVESKLISGIEELAKYGLYPLAFEAPHYTMSQQGYEVVSKYFSTYVGQIQLSDKNWEIMEPTPYITTPSFLNGMKLLPETMGYVQPDDPQAIQKMMGNAERFKWSNDGMYAAFYHPYLGSEKFKKLLSELEKLPNVSWIDLKQMDTWVKSENVSIHTENGEIVADVNRGDVIWKSLAAVLFYVNQFVIKLAWGTAIIGGAAVAIFIAFTFYLAVGKKKQVED